MHQWKLLCVKQNVGGGVCEILFGWEGKGGNVHVSVEIGAKTGQGHTRTAGAVITVEHRR